MASLQPHRSKPPVNPLRFPHETCIKTGLQPARIAWQVSSPTVKSVDSMWSTESMQKARKTRTTRHLVGMVLDRSQTEFSVGSRAWWPFHSRVAVHLVVIVGTETPMIHQFNPSSWGIQLIQWVKKVLSIDIPCYTPWVFVSSPWQVVIIWYHPISTTPEELGTKHGWLHTPPFSSMFFRAISTSVLKRDFGPPHLRIWGHQRVAKPLRIYGLGNLQTSTRHWRKTLAWHDLPICDCRLPPI